METKKVNAERTNLCIDLKRYPTIFYNAIYCFILHFYYSQYSLCPLKVTVPINYYE